ncbi:hypothetical protein C8F04DRAFT_954244 [Mycena alexandri]|uniref:BTB domain-containing protein n=1 Tax=Mycena alexandri TaxID=1745969 RepID=A0AAD6X5C5_9AGAR|nr:hypothetical protein C8F04DRAFT_980223 [Mycena alexandri]KAJ7036110.1 hypothetical protein C8F04DRAFT_954244 [Mycena alexandri]
MTPTSRRILWSPDEGCIIIKADKREFRVSRHLLAFHSPIFASMFELATGNEVELFQDSSEEVSAFLSALLDSRYFPPPPAIVNFEDALCILRLAHKYDVPFLLERSILHLENIYPMTLAGSLADIVVQSPGGEFNFWAADVFRKVGVIWLLPFTYFSISVEPWQNYRAQFPLEIQEMALRVQVANVQNSIRLLEFITGESACYSKAHCEKHKQKTIRLFIQRCAEDFSLGINFLRQWDSLGWQKLREVLCAQCFQDARVRYQQKLDIMWNELPGVCEMGGWDNLAKKRVDYFHDLGESMKQRSRDEYTRTTMAV